MGGTDSQQEPHNGKFCGRMKCVYGYLLQLLLASTVGKWKVCECETLYVKCVPVLKDLLGPDHSQHAAVILVCVFL